MKLASQILFFKNKAEKWQYPVRTPAGTLELLLTSQDLKKKLWILAKRVSSSGEYEKVRIVRNMPHFVF